LSKDKNLGFGSNIYKSDNNTQNMSTTEKLNNIAEDILLLEKELLASKNHTQDEFAIPPIERSAGKDSRMSTSRDSPNYRIARDVGSPSRSLPNKSQSPTATDPNLLSMGGFFLDTLKNRRTSKPEYMHIGETINSIYV
jgi:hypothetical protein